MKYRLRELSLGRFHIIAPNGLPIYDDAPYGNDKPLIFRDEDSAIEVVNRMNLELETKTEP